MSQPDRGWVLLVEDLRALAKHTGPVRIEMSTLRGFAKYKSTFSLDGISVDPGALAMHFPGTVR